MVSSASWGAIEAPERNPSLLHGLGQVVKGLVFEFPKTVLDATLSGPPIVGTSVGILAGAAAMMRVTFAGLQEMVRGFDPWGIKHEDRR